MSDPLLFSQRKAIARQFDEWLAENKGVANHRINLLSFLDSKGYLHRDAIRRDLEKDKGE